MILYNKDGSHEIAIVGGSAAEDAARAKLTGKVIITLGDSYTAKWNGSGAFGAGAKLEELAKKYKMILDNRGIGSASIAERRPEDNDDHPERRMTNMTDAIVNDYTAQGGYTINGIAYSPDDVGLITFMGGVNDPNGISYRLGTGIHDTERTLMYGALNYIFSILQETFPKATLLCITQPPSYNHTVSEVTNDTYAQEIGFENRAEVQRMTDVQFSTYCLAVKEDIVKKMAWAYGLPILDLFTEFPSVHVAANRTKYWASDKLHMTQAGNTIIVGALERKMLELFGQ